MSIESIVIILAGVGLLAAISALDQRRRRIVLFKEPDREDLRDSEIYERFYFDSNRPESEIATIWNEVASALRLPPGKLRPHDKFGHDVGSGYVTSEELDDLFKRGVVRARSLGVDVDFEHIETIDDYIKAFATSKK